VERNSEVRAVTAPRRVRPATGLHHDLVHGHDGAEPEAR
jgi:hypothetical protein